MEFTIHHQVLLWVFAVALVMGTVANKTNFCTMGAVSDWVNIGDTGRLRAWLLAMAVALAGVLLLEAGGKLSLAGGTFPPYRSEGFAWLRYLLGGAMFGVGMTLASGCGNKTLVRIGGGNLKSLVVLAIASVAAYAMLWTELFEKAFLGWIGPTTVSLAKHGMASQELGDIIGWLVGAEAGKLHLIVGGLVAAALLVLVFSARDFRTHFDNILGGVTVGLSIVAGWTITGGSMGAAWKEYAELASEVPSRVEVQSFTFISPMGDGLRYLMAPTQTAYINFGIMAVAGVITGSLLWSLVRRSFRVEWFVSLADFLRHAAGAVLMGVGGVLSMGCTVGQAITGISALALGSFLTFAAIVAGAAATMKFEYWRMMRGA